MLGTGRDEAGREMKNALHHVKRHGVVGSRFSDAGRKDKAKDSGARFFVGPHGIEQGGGWNAGPGRQRTHATNQRDDARNVVGTRQAQLVAEESGGHHAPSHGFAVLIAAVVRDTFEGMGKGMAVIEDFAEAGLVFVATYDAGFDRDVSRNQKTQQMAISSQHFLYVFF